MSTTTQPLSVAELTELAPDSWVNDGFTAVIRSIERKLSTKTNKPFWKCKLGDTTGSATVGATLFFAPKFKEGDQVDFLGQGIKFKNGQYGPEVSIGDKAEIHVVGHSAHHEEQVERAATGQPAVNGTAQPVNGQTVGMAIKAALDLLTTDLPNDKVLALASGQQFWSHVHMAASDIIRVSRLLEHGKLAPSIKDRLNPPPACSPAPPPTTTKRSGPTDDEMANRTTGDADEDVPF